MGKGYLHAFCEIDVFIRRVYMILNELQALNAASVALDNFQTKRFVIQVFETIVSYKKSTKVNILDCVARFIAVLFT